MNKGFTLVELLIVIAIIGILVAAIAPRYVSFTTDAKIAATQANLSSLRGALTLYAGNNEGSYPGNTSLSAFLVPSYIQEIPNNKINDSTTVQASNNCTGSPAWVYNSSDGVIRACSGTSVQSW